MIVNYSARSVTVDATECVHVYIPVVLMEHDSHGTYNQKRNYFTFQSSEMYIMYHHDSLMLVFAIDVSPNY